MRKPLALLCTLTLALAVAACGSSGGSDGSGDETTTTKAKATTTTEAGGSTTTEAGDGSTTSAPEPTDVSAEQYTAAFTKGLSSGDKDGGDLVLPAAAAACVAPKFVAAMTVQQLNAAGITEEDASDPGFNPADVGIDESQAETLVDAFADCDFDIVSELALALSAGLSDEQQQCTEDNIDPDLAFPLLVKTFSTGDADPEFEALLADLNKSCDLPDA